MAQSKQKGNKEKPLTIKEKAFCREYAKTGNGTQSVKKAGYKVSNDNSATSISCRLLGKVTVQNEITRLMNKKEEKAIADSIDVMTFLTRVMNGEIKDQFNLDASLNDRIKAAQELAKRTVDIDNRLKGVPDGNITIKVDWKKD